MKMLLASSAMIEAAAGLALLACPSIAAGLLLGGPLESPVSLTVARVGGAGLLALGIACWQMRRETPSLTARGMISAMTVYNIGAMVLLAYAGLGYQLHGAALWPAVMLHAAMTVWCLASLTGGTPKKEA